MVEKQKNIDKLEKGLFTQLLKVKLYNTIRVGLQTVEGAEAVFAERRKDLMKFESKRGSFSFIYITLR